MSRRRVIPLLLATLPAFVALLVGLTHPRHLDAASAGYWFGLHIALLPVFPLIGAIPWLLARSSGRVWARVAGVGGFVFGVFYTALDVLAGIGAGAETLAGVDGGNAPLFRIGDTLAAIGVVGMCAGLAIAGFAVGRQVGVIALPGALLAVVGAALILPGHVWFPIGTLGLALLIAGTATLVLQTESVRSSSRNSHGTSSPSAS